MRTLRALLISCCGCLAVCLPAQDGLQHPFQEHSVAAGLLDLSQLRRQAPLAPPGSLWWAADFQDQRAHISQQLALLALHDEEVPPLVPIIAQGQTLFLAFGRDRAAIGPAAICLFDAGAAAELTDQWLLAQGSESDEALRSGPFTGREYRDHFFYGRDQERLLLVSKNLLQAAGTAASKPQALPESVIALQIDLGAILSDLADRSHIEEAVLAQFFGPDWQQHPLRLHHQAQVRDGSWCGSVVLEGRPAPLLRPVSAKLSKCLPADAHLLAAAACEPARTLALVQTLLREIRLLAQLLGLPEPGPELAQLVELGLRGSLGLGLAELAASLAGDAGFGCSWSEDGSLEFFVLLSLRDAGAIEQALRTRFRSLEGKLPGNEPAYALDHPALPGGRLEMVISGDLLFLGSDARLLGRLLAGERAAEPIPPDAFAYARLDLPRIVELVYPAVHEWVEMNEDSLGAPPLQALAGPLYFAEKNFLARLASGAIPSPPRPSDIYLGEFVSPRLAHLGRQLPTKDLAAELNKSLRLYRSPEGHTPLRLHTAARTQLGYLRISSSQKDGPLSLAEVEQQLQELEYLAGPALADLQIIDAQPQAHFGPQWLPSLPLLRQHLPARYQWSLHGHGGAGLFAQESGLPLQAVLPLLLAIVAEN